MPRWTPAPIVGGAYKDDARAFSVQDTVNWIPERAESDGTRSDGMLRDAPGAHVVCDLGTNAPIRGLHNCEGRLLAVSGPTLFEVAADYTATSRGSIPGVSRVSIAHNQITGGNEVLIANGQAGYVYNTVAETLAQITDESYPGAICVDYLAQVLPQIEPQRRFWFHSDVTQATQYISTDEYEAESAPDLLVTLIASHGQLLVFGDRTGEFYAATGGNTSFFERLEGTTMEVGCASPHAVVRLDSTVFWIGSDGKGYRLSGYNAQRITTHAIEQAWSRCDLKKSFAFTFEDRGHTIAYFNFPDGGTWGYDVATQEWHRRESKGLTRWRINALVYWNGHWIGGDYSNGKLYRLDWDHKLECCEPLERRRVSGVLHDNQNDVGVNAAEFVFETGGPASTVQDGAPPSISGALPDGKVGDVVSYQYVIIRSYPGQVVSLTLTGALPTGLSLSAAGLVTGTLTAAGAFSWSILPAGECVTGEAFADSAATDVKVLLWDGGSFKGVRTALVAAGTTGLDALLTGSMPQYASGGRLLVETVASWKPYQYDATTAQFSELTITGTKYGARAAIIPGGEYIVSVADTGATFSYYVYVWNGSGYTLGNGPYVATGANVGPLRFSPDGTKLAHVDAGNKTFIHAFAAGVLTVGSSRSGAVDKIAWHPGSRYLAYASSQPEPGNGAVAVIDTTGAFPLVGSAVAACSGNRAALAWHPNGAHIYCAGDYNADVSNLLHLSFDATTGPALVARVTPISGTTGPDNCDVSRDGLFLVAAEYDGAHARVYTLANGAPTLSQSLTISGRSAWWVNNDV